jgi:hypothetical protein
VNGCIVFKQLASGNNEHVGGFKKNMKTANPKTWMKVHIEKENFREND